MSCFVCDRIDLILKGKNPYYVCELETGYVVLGDYQRFKGYTVFICKQHVSQLHELEHSFKMKYLEEMSLVAEAVFRIFQPDKMNYELLGNSGAHIHFHLFPRNEGDLGKYGNNGNGPVWWLPKEELYNDVYKPSLEELKRSTTLLKEEIEKLKRL